LLCIDFVNLERFLECPTSLFCLVLIRVSPAKLAAISMVTALVSAWAADTTVNVLYAGSLVNLMERSAGPAFEQKSGDRFQGYAGGSKALLCASCERAGPNGSGAWNANLERKCNWISCGWY
jgi:hypothetical protein